MSYTQNFSVNTLIDNVEKNTKSVSRYIQPEWLKEYYEAVTSANAALLRASVKESEKLYSFMPK